MPDEAEHNLKSKSVEEFNKPQRPVRVFLSYASEDSDIAKAIYDSFIALKAKSSSNIRVIWDKKSLEPGSPLPVRDDIESKLLITDFFIIIYTGVLKKSHSYTGEEIGFFRGLMSKEGGVSSSRKIFLIYFGEQPTISANELGINLKIEQSKLSDTRELFRKFVEKRIHGNDYNNITTLYETVGHSADAKLPDNSGAKSYTPAEWSIYTTERNNEIKNKIVPELMLNLYDSFRKRVKKKAVEQRLIEFRISREQLQCDPIKCDPIKSLPSETTLTESGNAFTTLGIDEQANEIKWKDFKNSVTEKLGSDAAPMISSIEGSAVSALSPSLNRDDEQIIKDPKSGELYRIIVTKQYEFYDGSKLLNMFFIPVMRLAFLKDTPVGITLGLINVAVKYRELFLNPASEMSLQAFYKVSGRALVEEVKKAVHDITAIEGESRILNLDKWKSQALYYGDSTKDAKKIAEFSKEWEATRDALLEAGNSIIANSEEGSVEQQEKLRASWMSALAKFTDTSNKINSDVLTAAIDNLRGYLSLNLPAPEKVGGAPIPEEVGKK
jgi:hypothetical protein